MPFCRTKCSYCNFASDVFSRVVFERYVDRVCQQIADWRQTAMEMAGRAEPEVDSIYLGGGTPTVLEVGQFCRIFSAIRTEFDVQASAEVTVECAPGTLTLEMRETLLRCGVNRVSLGVQSFVDGEAAAVGRLHKRATIVDDIAQLRSDGISNISIDLIAGLPHQTAASWDQSVSETIATGAGHVSVYMLEVDEDSRLGRELIAGGTKYHAHFVPDEEAIADFYIAACEKLEAAGVPQYEISNFAREGFQSRHNLKYWTRQPYLGFGVDAHSMLPSASGNEEGVRFATSESLEKYVAGAPLQRTVVSQATAMEESFFLGLRLNEGVDLREIARSFGQPAVEQCEPRVSELIDQRLLERAGNRLRLTPRGRLLSNEVFQAFLTSTEVPARPL